MINRSAFAKTNLVTTNYKTSPTFLRGLCICQSVVLKQMLYVKKKQRLASSCAGLDTLIIKKNIIEEFTKKDNVTSFILLNYDFETVLNYLKNQLYFNKKQFFLDLNLEFHQRTTIVCFPETLIKIITIG